MRKLVFSLSTILIFAFYMVLIRQNSRAADNSAAGISPSPVAATPSVSQPPAQAPRLSGANPSQPPKNSGMYADGTYTGTPVNAYVGIVQVAAVVSGGKLTEVQILQYPNDASYSRYVNQIALPMLKQEAVQAQNANVNIVSGATLTSEGFQQSLGSALSQAAS